jgi:HK97 gp10 family phage protein
MIDVEIRGLRETQQEMERIVRDLRGAPYLNAMRRATLLVQRSAKPLAPVDTGRLRASITPEVRAMGATVEGVVGSNVTYAPFVELGSKPHFPPIAAIMGWVHRQGMAGMYSIRSHRRVGSKATQASEDRSVAFLIARSIARRGGKAHPFLQPAFEENAEPIVRLLGDAVGQIVRSD